jgi:DNA-binding response OmpR family regulator
VVEDDLDVAESVRDSLEWNGHRVRVVDEPAKAWREVLKRAPDVVLTDFHLGAETSESGLRGLVSCWPSVHRVLMSSAPENEWRHLLDEGIIERAVPKPFELDELLTAVEAVAA